jgi:hypothetical protein
MCVSTLFTTSTPINHNNHIDHKNHSEDKVTTVSKSRKDKTLLTAYFSLPNRKTYIFCVSLLAFTFSFLVLASAQTVTITPGDNPSSVVIMGDSVTFSTGILSDATISNAELEVEVPAGFELLVSTPNFKSGSLSGDKRTGRILIASLSQNTLLTLTVYVRALCDAETATLPTDRKIKYSFYLSALETSPLTTKTINNGIQNINPPILNITYPPSDIVAMNTVYTRIFTIVQTRNHSHVNNIQVVAPCDVTGFDISKVEVRRNGDKPWTEITIEKTPAGYRYLIKRDKFFTPANGYPNSQLGHNDTLQIRETVRLLKCDAGNLDYNIAYGDTATFCVSAASTETVTYSQLNYAYTPDIYQTAYYIPGGPTSDGRYVTRVLNNSAQAEAIMHDLAVNCIGMNNYVLKSAYFTDASGNPILNGTDTVFIPITKFGDNQYQVVFSDLNNPVMVTYYEARGLRDLDGDGRYNDLPKSNSFHFTIRYNYDLNTGDCPIGIVDYITRVFRLYYKTFCKGNYQSYVRNYGAEGNVTTNAWQGCFRFTSIRNIAITTANLQPNGQARISGNLYSTGDGSVKVRGEDMLNLAINGVSSYFSTIVLPTGLSFDATQTNPVRIGSTNLTTANYTVTGNTIRIKWTANWGANDYIFNIAVKNNGTVDNTKTLQIYHEYDYGNTGIPQKFGCVSTPIPYLQLFPCSYLGITSFNMERRSFGYTDINKTTRVTDPNVARSLGFNMKIISPFDDVDMEGQFKANTNISTGGGNQIRINFSYIYNSDAALFDIVDGSANGISLYYNNTTSIQIPSSAMTKAWTEGTQTQLISFDVAPYLNAAGISALNTNDDLKAVIHLRATAALPGTGVDLYAQMQPITIIGGTTHECSPLMDMIKIWNSDWASKVDCSGGIGGCISNFYHNTTYNASALDFVVLWGTGQANVWGNEYRPNGDNFSAVVVRYPNLLRINSVSMLTNGIKGNMSTRVLTSSEYSVSYSNGETYVTINSGVTRDYMSSNSATGLGYSINFDMINPTANSNTGYMPNFWYTLSYDNYPTSAAPRRDNFTDIPSNLPANGGMFNYPYQYTITPIPINAVPVSTRAEWTVRITNQSAFIADDHTLPNSWLAVECPPGVVPQELRDASTNTAIPASFVKYASGAVDKYWIKIGTVSANPTADYILSCTYSVCTGTPQLTLKYGMSKIAYPTDPDAGYSNYGSPGKLAGVVSTNISYTPPVIKYAGRLTHVPNAANNTNNFCEAVTFEGEYSNGLATNVGRLQLRVTLPDGASYHSSYTPQVKFGDGGWAAVASVDESQPGELMITLDDSKELRAFGSANNGDKAWVRYALFISCGIRNEIQFPVEFIGRSGCGTAVSENTADVAPLKIYGMSPPPAYMLQNLALTPNASAPYIYTSGTSPTNGEMSLSGRYVLAGNAEANVIAIIDLPTNLRMESYNSNLAFTQSGTSLTADMPDNDGPGAIYNFYDIRLVPENPTAWLEDSVTIYIRVGKKLNLSCNSQNCVMMDRITLDSIRFAVKKLDVRFSDSIASRGSYGNATTEHVVIDGWLVNEGVSSYFDADVLNLDLWYRDGTSWLPVVGAIGLQVNDVNHGIDSAAFHIVADIPSSVPVCEMVVVLRPHNDGNNSKNPWLVDSLSIAVPPPVYEISQPTPICPMWVDTPIGDAAIAGYTYSWTPVDYLHSATSAPAKFTYDYASHPVVNDTILQYLVTITRPHNCESVDTVFVRLKGIPSVNDLKDTVVCHGKKLTVVFEDATNTSSHSDSLTTFGWTANGYINGLSSPVNFGFGNIVDSVLTNPTSAPVMATLTVTPTKNGCTGVSKDFSVKALPQSLYNYPDLRIRACPTVGTQINLAKYIDTLELTKLNWSPSPPIDAFGSVAANYLAYSSVRTFTYTVSNTCLTTDITRKIYVERLNPGRMRPLRDTIVICYERADMVQINQIFGIDAGTGTWEYYSLTPDDIDAYVTESHSSAYRGAVVLNGKALYESAIPTIKYHGIDVKKAVFTYTPENGNCLAGKSYTIVVILTGK